jgi:hypothetical protein
MEPTWQRCIVKSACIPAVAVDTGSIKDSSPNFQVAREPGKIGDIRPGTTLVVPADGAASMALIGEKR